MKRCNGNVRPAPPFFTPDLVQRVIDQAANAKVVSEGGTGPNWLPVTKVAPSKPTLRLAESEAAQPEQPIELPASDAGDRPSPTPIGEKRGRSPSLRSVPPAAGTRPASSSFPTRAATTSADQAHSAPREPTASRARAPRYDGPAATNSPSPDRQTTIVPLKPTGIFAYAERVAGARRYLTGKGFTVRQHDHNEQIVRWAISGHFGLHSTEGLFRIAQSQGWEASQ